MSDFSRRIIYKIIIVIINNKILSESQFGWEYNDTPSLRYKTEVSVIETTMKASYCSK